MTSNEESIIQNRKINEERAKKSDKKIKQYSKLICSFPFVENVCISGSLSKGILTADGDIDYFIICQPNRLWLCRTLLILYKKIFLLNSKKYFCVNYFIDTDTFVIPDKNIYTATEIATLIPINNISLFNRFVNENLWVYKQFPNINENRTTPYFNYTKNKISQIIEKCLGGKLGNKLDDYFLKLTLKTWKKRFPHLNTIDFELNMRSKKYASKHHPQGFQSKVLLEIDKKLQNYIP